MKKVWVLSLLISGSVFAQKPKPHSVVEIKLPAEDESYFISGNQRILNRSGYPTAIYAPNYKVQAGLPEQMARQYLNASKQQLGLSISNLQTDLLLHKILQTVNGTVVRFRQTFKGLPVNKNAEITIHINNDNTVDFVMNGFRQGVQLTNTQPTISAAAARQITENYLQMNGAANFSSNQLMVLQNNGQHYLVYKVVLEANAPVGEWESYIDANNGTILKLEDVSCYHHKKNKKPTYRRTTQPTANGTATVFDPDPLTTARATYGGSYVDGSDANSPTFNAQLKTVTLPDITLAAGVYSLTGPYATIQDFEAPNKGLFTQATSNFSYGRDADNFEAVMCYYHIDASMRYLNTTLGLTIMPYQYTGGVRVDPSGLSGADNSHYLGASGRVAFGEGGVDDAEDADVIIHELGHGLHDWATSGGLSQVNGLSEGTGDYWAASYSRAKGYWLTTDAGYNWTFNWDGHNPFWGGRVINYTPIYPGGLVNQIHTDGQIWATAMMRIWNDIGQQKADRVFWRGLQMTNGSSNQNDAANAVYTAAGTLGYTNAERLAIHTRLTAAGYTLPAFTLPVTVGSFTATSKENSVELRWTLEQEITGNRYTLEKSNNSLDFYSILERTASSTNYNTHYKHIDNGPFGKITYYRLKETTPSNQINYSKIIAISTSKKMTMAIFPNPVKDNIEISSPAMTGKIQIQITDLSGKIVYSKEYYNSTGLKQTLDVQHLKKGSYQIIVRNDDVKLIKQLLKQ